MENSESKDLEQNAQTEEAPAEAEAVDEQPADDKLAAELAQVKDQLLRTMAEYDNHRKRTAKESWSFARTSSQTLFQTSCRSWTISKERSRRIALTRSTSRAFR